MHSSDGTTFTDQYSTTWLQERALDFLEQRETDDATPWFLELSLTAPHDSGYSPVQLAKMVESQYEDAPVPPLDVNPSRSEGAPGGDPLTDKLSWVRNWSDNRPILRHGPFPGLREQSLRTLYSVDDLVETVLQRMRALEEAQDTLAVFISDNGYLWREHGDASLETSPPSDDCSDPPQDPPETCQLTRRASGWVGRQSPTPRRSRCRC